MGLLRKLRGAISLGLVWAIPWWFAGALLSPYLRTLANALPPRSIADAAFDGLLTGWYGFLAGVVFSGLLAVVGRRRAFREITPPQMAGWGIASAALLMAPPMVYMLANRADGWRTQDIVYITSGFLLSAGCAAATLALARRAKEPSLPVSDPAST